MALINPASKDIIPESLNLHATLPTQVACEKAKYHIYLPKNPIEKDGPISFLAVSGDFDCIDPYNTYLDTKLQILKADGTRVVNADADNKLSLFVNGIGTAWIQHCDVKLNNKKISSNDNNYAHRADLENRLSYSVEVKENSLRITGFDSETLAFDDIPVADLNLDDEANVADKALNRRYERSKMSKVIRVITRVHTEICEQPKLLPPNSVLDFTFHPNEASFVVMTKRDMKYQYKILECKLYVHHVRVNPTIARELEDITIKGENMKYPVRRVEVTYFTKSEGMTDLSQPNIIQGKKPKRVIIGLLNLDAFHGHYKKDPFNYKHFNTREVSIRVDGERYPEEGMKMNVDEGDVLIPVMNLLMTTDSFLTDRDIGINLTNYLLRNNLFAFNLSPTGSSGGENFELSTNVTVDAQIMLSAATATAVAVLVYAEYDSEIIIDADRIVTYNE